MAVAAWTANTAVSVGNIRRATSAQKTGLFFQVTVAGTTAATEPLWGTDVGSVSTDNNVTWVAISSVYEELSVLTPNTIIELFEMHLSNDLHGSNDIYRWHEGCNADVDGNIVWGGNAYTRLPVEATGFEYSNTGSLPRPTLSFSNLDGIMTTLLLLVNGTTIGNDLGGAEIRRIRTLKKFLDGEGTADPNAQWPMEVWYIDRKAAETREVVSFELASKLDLPGVKVPKRQLVGNVCQWAYRSSECSYTGSNYWNAQDQPVGAITEDRCGKRLGSCKLRFGTDAVLPFGSFPTAGRTR